MNRRVRARLGPSIAVALLLAGFAAPATWAAPATLAIHDLGTFDGFDSEGNAVNDRGQIVGTALVGPQEVRSFLWSSGAMTDLGPGRLALDINNRGQVLLQQPVFEIDNPNSCFLRDGENQIILGTPSGTHCFAADLNNLGQVVGTIQQRGGPVHPSLGFLWDSGTIVDLGSLGGSYTVALAIYDRGQVVGGSTMGVFEATHAFLWEAGKMTDLGPPGASWSIASAINNRGQVVVQSGSHIYL